MVYRPSGGVQQPHERGTNDEYQGYHPVIDRGFSSQKLNRRAEVIVVQSMGGVGVGVDKALP